VETMKKIVIIFILMFSVTTINADDLDDFRKLSAGHA